MSRFGVGWKGPSQTAPTPRLCEIVEPPAQPLEVADPVAVRVLERLEVEVVEDRVSVPEVRGMTELYRAAAASNRGGSSVSPCSPGLDLNR